VALYELDRTRQPELVRARRQPRLILEGDVPWQVDLAKRRYPASFDFLAGEMWMRNIVLKGPMMFLPIRTDNAFLVAFISTTPWRPSEAECNVTMVCAEEGAMWDAMILLRASIEWGKRRKCTIWRLSSETDFDLEPIALKLGAHERSIRYVMRLDNG
jgi:hypothetical protein